MMLQSGEAASLISFSMGLNMKKLFTTLVMPLLAAVLLSACGDTPSGGSDSAAPAAAAKPAAPPPATPAKIVVGLDDNFPPMGFRDEKSQLVGFDIDLARETAKRLDRDVEFKPIDWGAKEAELNSGRVDVLWNGLTITEERRQNINFTAPYMENHQIIVVTAASPIRNKRALADKIVGAQEGSSAVGAIEKDEETASTLKEVKRYGDNVTALMDLTAGRIDALVVDEVVGRYYTAKKPDAYLILDENFGTEEYGVGTRKNDIELLEQLQQAMDAMKQDGSAARIATKWFGKDIIK